MPAVGKMKGNEWTDTFFCTGVYKEYFYRWLACHMTLLLPNGHWCPQSGNNKYFVYYIIVISLVSFLRTNNKNMLVEIIMLSDHLCVQASVCVWQWGWGVGGGVAHPVQLEIQPNNSLLKLTVHNSICYTYFTQKNFQQLFYLQQSNILSNHFI